MTRSRRSFGQIRQKASGRWHASFVVPGGATSRVNAPHTFLSRRDAERWLSSVEVDMRRGDWRPAQTRLTLREFGDPFLADHFGNLAPATRVGYRRLWSKRIVPSLGDRPLRDLRPSHIRSWLAALGKEGLSPSQVRQAFRLLSMILDAAVGDEHADANPCAPLRRTLPRMPEPARRRLTDAEVTALREAMPEGRYRLFFDVLADTGLRIAEGFALTRASVDLLHGCLVVAVATSEAEGLEIKDTKTHKVRRTALPQYLAEALERHLETLPAAPDSLLWPSRTGRPLRYASYRRWVWDPAAVKAGLATPKPQPELASGSVDPIPGRPGPKPKPRLEDLWTVDVTPHNLRSTHISLVDDKFGRTAAQQRAGHAPGSDTTEKHYIRAGDTVDLAVASWLDQRHEAPPQAQTGDV